MKKIGLITNAVSILILVLTLIISVSYGWYTNNKNTDASGMAQAASNSLSILNQGIYKNIIGDNPFPDGNENKIEGVLSGDIIYYSVSVSLANNKNKDVKYDLNISVININGGEYFACPSIKIEPNPNGSSTEETFEYNGQSYEIFELDGEQYFILSEDSNEYIYYLYESLGGEILTRKPKLIVENPNGTLTGETFVYNNVSYPTYLDENDKEYFITYDISTVDGVDYVNASYINYIYEETIGDEAVRYNMCDVYTMGLFKVFGRDSNDVYVELEDHSQNTTMLSFDRETGLDKEINNFVLLNYENWDPSTYEEIVFSFAIKFDYSVFEGKINTSCVSDKEFIFNHIIISESEVSE